MNLALAPLQLEPPVATFLARHGHARASIAVLPGDASARRYLRLEGAGLLLMEDRTDPVGFAAFLRIARHLNTLGLSAPRVIGADPAVGLALIEDFGLTTYSAQLARGVDEEKLYRLATDALLHLHGHSLAADVTAPEYDLATLLDELSIFSQWFLGALRPDEDVAGFDQEFRTLWAKALEPLKNAPQTLVLRDFHVDNLMELEGRGGIQRCGLLDFQDAVLGPAEYDLVSLLQDARRDLSDGLEAKMLAHYIERAPEHAGGADTIAHRYHLLGAQRHTRIAGVFMRLAKRDGKPGYLTFMPRVLRQMQAAFAAAQLHEIKELIDKTIPEWRDAGAAIAKHT